MDVQRQHGMLTSIIVLVLVQICSCRPTPAARITDNRWLVSDQVIVLLSQDAPNETAAAAELVKLASAAVSNSAETTNDAIRSSQSTGAAQMEVLSLLDGSAIASAQSAVAADAPPAAAAASSSSSRASSRGLIIKARPEAVRVISRSPMVAAVFPDRIVRAQRILSPATTATSEPVSVAEPHAALAAEALSASAAVPCTKPEELAAGLQAIPSSTFKWPQCMSKSTRIVWVASACGGSNTAGTRVQYVEVRALDIYSGEIFQFARNGKLEECILRPDRARASWTRQLFGTCGKAPKAAPSLPARVKVCSEGPTLPPRPPPTASPSPVPSPTQPPAESPTPSGVVINGPALPRVTVTDGQQIPRGVWQIEAARKLGATDATVPSVTGVPDAQKVVVGVVDSGIDAKHYDLEYAGGQSFHFVDKAADVDNYGHGTHIAGIIGAKNNRQGVVGISPGVPVFSLKVLDERGQGTISSTMAAVRWVIDTGLKQYNIKVINLSLLAYVDPADVNYANFESFVCGVMKEASDAGIVVTVAAGNYGANMRGYFPAVCPTVAAVTSLDASATSPSANANWLSASDATAEERSLLFSAPGTSVLSTVPQDIEPSGLYTLSGTSMAAPAVAAVATNCLLSGACPAGGTGAQHLATLKAAALERLTMLPSFGYADAGDKGRLYGPLVWSKY